MDGNQAYLLSTWTVKQAKADGGAGSMSGHSLLVLAKQGDGRLEDQGEHLHPTAATELIKPKPRGGRTMMKWTGSAIALTAVLVAAAMMPPLKAAEETPMITVYEANVTDMDGYKSQFLTAIQPKIDKAQERWLARGGKTTSLIGKPPENRIVMSIFASKARLDAFWAEAKDDFKIGQKYSTGMRFFAMPAMTPLPTISGTPTFEVYEANVTDMENYKNEFLQALQPKMEKHKQVFLARGSNAAETLIGEAPKNRIAITVWPNAEAAQAFWNDAKDDFKIGQKYATDMRIYEVEGVAQK